MKRRRYSKLVAAVYGTVWAILPKKLEEIVGVVELRSAGIRLTRQEIQARVGEVERPPILEYRDSAAFNGGASSQSVTTQPRIAILNLHGVIAQRMNLMMEISGGTSTELFGKAFDQAVADPSVMAIVINADSPGGTVPGTPELAEKIFAARGSKPIIAVANPMMASAAYWIASAADELAAAPSATGIGSVGVLNIHREDSKANAEAGHTFTIVRSVEHKAEGLPFEPLSEAARAHIESRVSGIHKDFVTAVAKHRGMKLGDVDAKFGEGRDYRAAEALERGMIDRIATLEAVIAELTERASAPQTNPAARTGRASTAKECPMDPKVKLALIKAGYAKAGDTDAQFEAALALFYQAQAKTVATDVAQILKDLEPAPVAAATTAPAQAAATTVVAATGVLSAKEILGLVATAGHGLTAEEKLTLQRELVSANPGLSLEQVLAKINEKAVAGNPPAGQRIEVTADARDKFTARARDAILCATWQGNYPKEIFDFRTGASMDWKPAGAEREFGLQTPIRIAMQCLIAAGYPTNKVLGLSKADVARLVCGGRPEEIGLGGMFASADGPAYNVSGMFSNILLDATNVLLRRSYDQGRSTFQIWMRRGPSIEDFKPVHRVIAGELGDPKAVPEDGTFDETTLTDGKESYKLTVWGQILSYSWQLLVNDRLGMITEFPVKLGASMRRKENRLAYATVKDNAALSDTVALFSDATHNNVTTGVIDAVNEYVAAWNTMAQKMSEQKGLDSNSAALGLMMKWCIFPPALRGIIRQSLGSPSGDATNPNLINIWQQGMQPVEEPELGAAAGGSDVVHYTAADSNEVDTIEYAYLQGLEAPRIEQETAFDRLAIRQRIYHAFGVKPLDFRGLQKHTGA